MPATEVRGPVRKRNMLIGLVRARIANGRSGTTTPESCTYGMLRLHRGDEQPKKCLTMLSVLLLAVGISGLSMAYPASAGQAACVADQPPDHYVEWSSEDPYVLLLPGDAAAQSFRPELNVLCTLFLQLYADANDLGDRVILNMTIRESLDGMSLASHRIDTILSSQHLENWDPFLHLVPGRMYYAVVEMADGSQALRWYWARASYDRGAAWVRVDGVWREEAVHDLLFATFGFNDPSSYPLPDPSWDQEEWRENNWKTYPVVATWMDINGDGAGDVYTFNNSYTDGSPVSANGSVSMEGLDRTRMAPVNLSMAFEFTSHLKAPDNRSSLRILVDRMADPSRNVTEAWPAWILLDSVEFLPLLFAPPGVSFDVLNLSWESTLEENSFRVYVKATPEDPQGEVWIYVGHFSTQSIIVRGPSVPHVDEQVPPWGMEPLSLFVVLGAAAAAFVSLAVLRRRSRSS